ncbi:hypothetical protein B0H13DRAFT_2093056, partial [Mycena leptocephala]
MCLCSHLSFFFLLSFRSLDIDGLSFRPEPTDIVTIMLTHSAFIVSLPFELCISHYQSHHHRQRRPVRVGCDHSGSLERLEVPLEGWSRMHGRGAVRYKQKKARRYVTLGWGAFPFTFLSFSSRVWASGCEGRRHEGSRPAPPRRQAACVRGAGGGVGR